MNQTNVSSDKQKHLCFELTCKFQAVWQELIKGKVESALSAIPTACQCPPTSFNRSQRNRNREWKGKAVLGCGEVEKLEGALHAELGGVQSCLYIWWSLSQPGSLFSLSDLPPSLTVSSALSLSVYPYIV